MEDRKLKAYMEIGERFYFRRKRYTCREAVAGFIESCELCDLKFPGACSVVKCKNYERRDGKNVVFQKAHHKRGDVKSSKNEGYCY